MSENDTYALWIIPDGDAYTMTNGYITRLSNAYRLPRFEPHVTVLGGIRLPEASELRELAASLDPFQIRLTREVEYRDEYFRCLFLQVYKTEDLKEIFSKASVLFGQESESYFPHLSLAYGDLPVWKKQEMVAELGPIPRIEFEVRAIYLVQASTRMDISNWSVVERFQFANP